MLFRTHQQDDLEAFCAMEQDAEGRRYVGGAPRTRAAAEDRFWNRAMHPPEGRLAMWATVLKEEGRYIGRCGVYPSFQGEERVDREGVLAFYLAREYWGRDLASEAGRAFVDFGFDELRLARIVASVEVGNAASVRVLEKLGFVLAEIEQGARSFYKFELMRPISWVENEGKITGEISC
jgi:ribosomal-protein-alanine N-acetyltransferase